MHHLSRGKKSLNEQYGLSWTWIAYASWGATKADTIKATERENEGSETVLGARMYLTAFPLPSQEREAMEI